jgi:hypothetical protein
MHSNPSDILSMGMYRRLFPDHLEITPNLSEVYELALAYYESRILSEDELVQNGAYFVRAGNRFTNHYLMCTGDPLKLPKHSSSRLRSFFENNQFRTGYATHGLFPYRGKFHPQMIKALINVMGLKPGDTILDPMMGSGTVPVEASLMEIKSIGFDASPFCQFMAQVKYDAITIPQAPLNEASNKFKQLFDFFTKIASPPNDGCDVRRDLSQGLNANTGESLAPFESFNMGQLADLVQCDRSDVLDFLLLAYLDSAGYSERSKRKSPLEQFRAILERYIFVVKKIQHVLNGSELDLGKTGLFKGDARAMKIDDQSVDGILFSPPYSFAINYLQNDYFHLNLMGENVDELRNEMIGLRGRNLKEKYKLYVEDMNKVLSECTRVLKPGRLCTIIVGTNDNQLSKALGVPKEDVTGLHQVLVALGSQHGFKPLRLLGRKISGIANTMRNEYIVILQKS